MECFQCGECCRTLFNHMLITREETALISKQTDVKLRVEEVRKNRFLVKHNGPCPFLKNNQCSIYPIRPCQCRLYHCGRLKPTDRRLEGIVDIRFLMLQNPEYKRFKEAMDKEAVDWGNRHGWNWRKMNGDNMVFP